MILLFGLLLLKEELLLIIFCEKAKLKFQINFQEFDQNLEKLLEKFK